MSNLDNLLGFKVLFGNPQGIAFHLDGCSGHRHEDISSPPSANKKKLAKGEFSREKFQALRQEDNHVISRQKKHVKKTKFKFIYRATELQENFHVREK